MLGWLVWLSGVAAMVLVVVLAVALHVPSIPKKRLLLVNVETMKVMM